MEGVKEGVTCKPPTSPPTSNNEHEQGDSECRRHRCYCCCRCHCMALSPPLATGSPTACARPTKHPGEPPNRPLTASVAATTITDNDDHVGVIVTVVTSPRPPHWVYHHPTHSFARWAPTTSHTSQSPHDKLAPRHHPTPPPQLTSTTSAASCAHDHLPNSWLMRPMRVQERGAHSAQYTEFNVNNMLNKCRIRRLSGVRWIYI